MVSNAHLVATQQGRPREAALKEMAAAKDRMVNRLVLVTTI